MTEPDDGQLVAPDTLSVIEYSIYDRHGAALRVRGIQVGLYVVSGGWPLFGGTVLDALTGTRIVNPCPWWVGHHPTGTLLTNAHTRDEALQIADAVSFGGPQVEANDSQRFNQAYLSSDACHWLNAITTLRNARQPYPDFRTWRRPQVAA